MLVSDNYQDSLIESLKDLNYASIYLETHLEGDEYGFDSQLFILALQQVLEALGSEYLTPEQTKLQKQQLEAIMQQSAPEALHQLRSWLQILGLNLTITVASEKLAEKSEILLQNQALSLEVAV